MISLLVLKRIELFKQSAQQGVDNFTFPIPDSDTIERLEAAVRMYPNIRKQYVSPSKQKNGILCYVIDFARTGRAPSAGERANQDGDEGLPGSVLRRRPGDVQLQRDRAEGAPAYEGLPRVPQLHARFHRKLPFSKGTALTSIPILFHRGMAPGRRERRTPPGQHQHRHQAGRRAEAGQAVQLPAADFPERGHNLLRLSRGLPGQLSRHTVVIAVLLAGRVIAQY